MGWIKTQPAQKLLVRVKFTGNPYSYEGERLPLKYTQTRVCRNSYTGTCTVPDSYTCLCERSLSLEKRLIIEQNTEVVLCILVN